MDETNTNISTVWAGLDAFEIGSISVGHAIRGRAQSDLAIQQLVVVRPCERAVSPSRTKSDQNPPASLTRFFGVGDYLRATTYALSPHHSSSELNNGARPRQGSAHGLS